MTSGSTAISTPGPTSTPAPTAADQAIAVILPAFNEAGRIDSTLRAIAAYRVHLGVDWPVVVADDGSTDGTADVARATAAEIGLPIEILRFPHRGKALTIRDAMLDLAGRTDARLLMMLDADDELRIDQLDHVAWATDPHAIYIGHRVSEVGGAVGTRPSPFRRFMSGGMRLASWVLLGLRFPDTQCGFKLFPRAIVPGLFGQQRSAGWVFDAELLVIAQRVSGLPVVEVPVTWSPRGVSKVSSRAAIGSVFALIAVAARYRAGRYRRIRIG
ncbi:MAG TPA: glycosyltransferase [Candidatus Limnocylindrales bacterium]